jgi:hypothetical protein
MALAVVFMARPQRSPNLYGFQPGEQEMTVGHGPRLHLGDEGGEIVGIDDERTLGIRRRIHRVRDEFEPSG